MDSPPIDVSALVAEIERDVARRRAAGEYPDALLRRIHYEINPADDDPPELLAAVGTPRAIASARPVLGPAIVFLKRALRRSLSWYVQPIANDQTRFNVAVLRELRAMQRRLDRVRARWGPPQSQPFSPRSEPAIAARADALLHALGEPRAPILVAGVPDGVRERLRARLASFEVRSAADPFDALERAADASLGAAVLVGVFARVTRRELLELVPSVARTLRPGGVMVFDAIDRPPSLAEDDDLTLESVTPAALSERLCERAGFMSIAYDASDDGWYVARAVRPG
jgi:hypothetical protein